MKQVQFDMIAKTLFGLEQVLENERKCFGCIQVFYSKQTRRTALKTDRSNVKTAAYYHSLSRLPWEEYMTIDTRFSIQVSQSVPMFRNTMFAGVDQSTWVSD